MNNTYPFVNTPLPYAYDSLEPYIDEKTMHLHHDRHLQTYIDNLNAIIKEHPELQTWTLEGLLELSAFLPKEIRQPVINNAGGVYNHHFFFDSMTPAGKQPEENPLLAEIARQFGSLEAFQEQLKKEALAVFGSGYAWLAADGGKLKIIRTANQDTPLPLDLQPLLALDVWEHAYYLKHYNQRAAYIDDWFSIVDWEKASRRFAEIPRYL